LGEILESVENPFPHSSGSCLTRRWSYVSSGGIFECSEFLEILLGKLSFQSEEFHEVSSLAYVAHQDRRVVETSESPGSALCIAEQLIRGDSPIIEYRRRREELTGEPEPG